MCVHVFTLLYSFIGYRNDEKLNIDFAVTMLGMKTVEQLTETKLVREVMYFLELKGSLPRSQYPFTGPDSGPNKSTTHLRILLLGPSFMLFLYLQQLLPSDLIHLFCMNVALYTFLLLRMYAILHILNSKKIPLSNTFKRSGVIPQNFA
jgi:hypothetical protein